MTEALRSTSFRIHISQSQFSIPFLIYAVEKVSLNNESV